MLAEASDYIGPLFDGVFTQGQPFTTLADRLFTINRNNYVEECYFAFRTVREFPKESMHMNALTKMLAERAPDTIHTAKNAGRGNDAELATYIVEKGKAIVVLAP